MPRERWRLLLRIRRGSGVRLVAGFVDEGVPSTRVAKDPGIAESGLRRRVDRQLVEVGRKPRVTKDERDELVGLRRENRALRMVRDLLSRGAAVFAGVTSFWK
jgi:transposase-like protein